MACGNIPLISKSQRSRAAQLIMLFGAAVSSWFHGKLIVRLDQICLETGYIFEVD